MSRRVGSSCIKSRCTPDLGTGQTVRAFVGRTRTSAHTLPSPRPPIPIRNLTLLPGGRNPVVSTNTGQMKSRTHRFPRGPPRGTRAKGVQRTRASTPPPSAGEPLRVAPLQLETSRRGHFRMEKRVSLAVGDLSRRTFPRARTAQCLPPHRRRNRVIDRHNERVDAPADKPSSMRGNRTARPEQCSGFVPL